MQPGQWSRPPWPLIRGVRPNSPQTSDQHPLGQAALVQVLDQARQRGVERRELAAAAREELAVVVPAPFGDGHERDPRLDQPAGEQAGLADPGPAVAVAEPRVLARRGRTPRGRAGR